jgi:RNA polymerase sigma-70 factor (ECF subfamily)
MTDRVTGSSAAAGAREPSEDGTAGSTGSDLVEQAIRRFQAGNDRPAAFRFLYETYFRAIERFFARKGLPPEDCLDLTQETFLGIYKGLDGYENRQRFSAWLYRVATTAFLKRHRSATTAKRAAVEVSRDGMEHPEATLAVPGRQLDGLLDEERWRALRTAVAELPEQMRDCLTLRLYHQLSYSEIAVIKKISIETVKAHLFRARKKLQEKLAGFALGDLED